MPHLHEDLSSECQTGPSTCQELRGVDWCAAQTHHGSHHHHQSASPVTFSFTNSHLTSQAKSLRVLLDTSTSTLYIQHTKSPLISTYTTCPKFEHFSSTWSKRCLLQWPPHWSRLPAVTLAPEGHSQQAKWSVQNTNLIASFPQLNSISLPPSPSPTSFHLT